MKDLKKDFKNKANILTNLIVIVILVLVLIGKEQYTNLATEWFASIMLALVTTTVSQSFVQKITGDFLEKILLKVKIFGKEYSVSLFVIVSLIVKMWLF